MLSRRASLGGLGTRSEPYIKASKAKRRPWDCCQPFNSIFTEVSYSKGEQPHCDGLQILFWSTSFPVAVFPHIFLPGILISFKDCYLLRIHMLGHLIRLPLLELESHSLMAVIFIICLIFVILDADEVAVHCLGIEGKSDECVDCSGFGDEFKGPGLELVSSGPFDIREAIRTCSFFN